MAQYHRFRHGGRAYEITTDGARQAALLAGPLPIYRWGAQIDGVDGTFPPIELLELMTGLRLGSSRCRDLLSKLDGIYLFAKELEVDRRGVGNE